MKLKTKQFTIAMAAALDLMSGAALGEDIDLYVSGGATANAPNVLLFLDNTSNWSANSQQWKKADVLLKCKSDATCQSYVNQVFGPDEDLKQGRVELRAIELVLKELVCNPATTPLNVNVGLMLISDTNGTAEANNTGGYIRQAVKPLDAAHCAALIGDLDLIDSEITNPLYKTPASADYGTPLYEAFKYYGGYANPTQAKQGLGGTPTDRTHFGTARYVEPNAFEDVDAFTNPGKNNYQSPISSTNSCGKNYLILVGNTWPNQEYGTNQNVNPPTNTLMTRLGRLPEEMQIYSTSKSDIRFGDEWTQFLASTDVSDQAGQQPVFTYTLNVYNKSADAKQTTLLRSMANVGGTGASGYFEVGGDLKKLVAAFKDIFTQIAAVNSVFASASLPVSVNTQGTYLNQVFIGMFRPDSDARPRWAGNLKQYQFSYDAASQSLFLADAAGSAAIDNANTGFITACARSFWTTDTPLGSAYWQDIPPNQTPPGTCLTSGTSVYSDSPDGNLVEKGAAAQQLRQISVANRTVKTCTSTTACDDALGEVVDFDTTNMSYTELGVADNAARDTLVSWVRGQNAGDGPPDGTGAYQTYNESVNPKEVRPTVHGDVVHSRPLVINYGNGTTNDVVVFYGAGDGMLHAVDGNQSGSGAGQELWSFIAPEFWTRLSRLRENTPLIAFPTVSTTPTPTKKDYFFDGGIGAYQERNSSGNVSKVYLYPSMRRGGRMVYGFDATSKPSPSTLPSLLWRFGCPNLSNDIGCVGTDAVKLGQTWSTPRVIVTKDGDPDPTNNPLYLTFGGGYDACEDAATPTCSGTTKGQGVFILDAVTGAQAEFIDLASVDSGAGRVIADIVPVDVNADNYTDVLYAADTRGNLWRINTSDPAAGYVGYAPSTWSSHTYLVAGVSDWSVQVSSRKFSYAPDVVTLGGINVVLLGTGDREQPLNGSFATGVQNRFYAFRDEYAKAVVSTVSDPSTEVLVVTSSQANSDTAGDITPTPTTCSDCLLNVTDTTLDYSTAVLGGKGWFIDLVVTSSPHEQVVTTPVTVGGATYFSTFQASDGSTASCSNLGTGRGYALNFLTGGLQSGDTSLAEDFTGGGIPPSPVAGVVEIGDDTVPFCLGCKPPEGGGSALEGTKVEIPIVQERKKVYRVRQIDE
ncbi:MAG: PilC/PilY family type IV pilus protein [Pseudomonadota bacterium]|nr:PilC/PilY family type IV pilus protein [Pseudomonadota bacterium]